MMLLSWACCMKQKDFMPFSILFVPFGLDAVLALFTIHRMYDIAHIAYTNSRTSLFILIAFYLFSSWNDNSRSTFYGSRWARGSESIVGRMKNYTHFESVGMSISQWWFCIDHFSFRSNIFVANKSTDYWSKCDLHCTMSCQHSNDDDDAANAKKYRRKNCNDVLWIGNFFVLIFISFSFPLAALIIFASFLSSDQRKTKIRSVS